MIFSKSISRCETQPAVDSTALPIAGTGTCFCSTGLPRGRPWKATGRHASALLPGRRCYFPLLTKPPSPRGLQVKASRFFRATPAVRRHLTLTNYHPCPSVQVSLPSCRSISFDSFRRHTQVTAMLPALRVVSISSRPLILPLPTTSPATRRHRPSLA